MLDFPHQLFLFETTPFGLFHIIRHSSTVVCHPVLLPSMDDMESIYWQVPRRE
ncbi:hypothetical protein STEG23_037324, partial [Scotinomys teguina]